MAVKRISTRSKQPEPVQEPRSEPPLSRERIAAAAVELLDAQGVGGLPMRRLADRLGSGVMSLYWHAHNTGDVFDLALDSQPAYRGPAQTAEPPAWRGQVCPDRTIDEEEKRVYVRLRCVGGSVIKKK